ncbi:peptide ABC transporter substrate-binding protein [Lusitaniella coriacea LEGE 07157]|uniref:Peptide ABC transporter substrate-binding protein n=1 Tax=Lusitaniella coriacea LEGE 07157 TaxID=945747 RepID=A0A8J7JAU9_9CYAN|nr:peptide ABC transporter substrate-binding protein [Lusitaniella coriacea]MBE9116560.1 peptide ABC transporter substrate-binding protein [Lusitaniella coriacea LEGE 07157]
MAINFLTQSSETSTVRLSREPIATPQPHRETVKILLIGSPQGVTNIIHTLHYLGFAEVGAWSPPQPTGNPGEVVSLLLRQLMLR